MINAVIVDDEQHCIDRLQRLLEQLPGKPVTITHTASTVADGIRVIQQYRPDLVFLDVQLQDQTSFDLLEQLPAKDFDIIFTTAFDQYAVKAFRFSAVDYLTKPIDVAELQEALTKIIDKNEKSGMADRMDNLLHNLKTMQGNSKRICVPVLNGLVFVNVSDIIRCQSEVNYTHLFLLGKQKLLVSKTLKEFDDLLTEYNFFRVHNSHLVNLAYVKSYTKGKGGYITMSDNTAIEVSTRRKDDFLKKLAEF